MMMKRKVNFSRKRRRTRPGRGEKGYVLIEVLVAMAIFGVISVGFLSALVAGYHGVIVAHDQTMAESLTRTALENVAKAPFAEVSDNDTYIMTSKFRVEIDADYIDPDTYASETEPTSLKMVTVTVRYIESGRALLVTHNAKVQS